MLKRLLAALVAVVTAGVIAHSATLSGLSGPQPAADLVSIVNGLIQTINSGITPQSMAPFSGPRNLLDNGEMLIQQRGTGTATCSTTSGIAATAYAADRWGCDVNVTSGAGQLTPITSSPTPPPGFSQSLKLVRNSGALTQPQCAWQELKTADVTQAAGQQVIFSGYLAALAGLSADNGNAANLVIITGTGTDQGMGALRSAVGMTASPAITPVWTGLATLQTTPVTLTTAYARYNGAAVAVPTNVTEMAVGVCFTPTATGAGTTDGLAFTGMQLEIAGINSATASAYEHRPTQLELARVQRYAVAVAEAASGVAQYNGNVTSATACEFAYTFPVQMDVAPTLSQVGTAITSGTTYKANSSTAGLTNVSAMATKVANGINAASFTITSAAMTAGQACTLEGLAGGAISLWSADF